jgi:hypothetical protein
VKSTSMAAPDLAVTELQVARIRNDSARVGAHFTISVCRARLIVVSSVERRDLMLLEILELCRAAR